VRPLKMTFSHGQRSDRLDAAAVRLQASFRGQRVRVAQQASPEAQAVRRAEAAGQAIARTAAAAASEAGKAVLDSCALSGLSPALSVELFSAAVGARPEGEGLLAQAAAGKTALMVAQAHQLPPGRCREAAALAAGEVAAQALVAQGKALALVAEESGRAAFRAGLDAGLVEQEAARAAAFAVGRAVATALPGRSFQEHAAEAALWAAKSAAAGLAPEQAEETGCLVAGRLAARGALLAGKSPARVGEEAGRAASRAATKVKMPP
ncbi:unnamed protein product, partial [Effrenium voratum]